MKIAIAIWNDCVSNVFDFADRILLVEIDGDKEISRLQISFESKSFPQRVSQLKSLKVDLLICGAISRVLAEMVTAAEIEVLAYVTGDIDDVLEAYRSGQLGQPQFAMPGCWPGARKGHRRSGQSGQRCRRRGNRGNIDL
jgi:predicted Fe-Mo cluster-binding NifX family protein